jgi:CBS domain containing-hemolysin-like protein
MEIAFISANRLKVQLEKKQGGLSSLIVSWFYDRSDYVIATMLVGNNVSLVIYGLQSAILLEPLIAKWISQDIWILIIQTIIATLVILFTAEFLPKTLFRIRPNMAVKIFAFPLLLFYTSLFPITWIAVKLSNLLLNKIIPKSENEDSDKGVFSKVDLTHLVNHNINGQSSDEEMEHEMKLFQNALDFSNVRLRECMIPRTEIAAVDIQENIENLNQLFIETGYSRILIYEENIDKIIGYAHHADLFKNPKNIVSIVRPVPIVPESMPANKLLQQLLSDKLSAAIVVDEFGGTAGLVTTEDVLEEIFGEIEDEHDIQSYVEELISDNEYKLSGRLEIDYLNDKYRLDLPISEEYETLAGLILDLHKSIPPINDSIQLGKFKFTILKSTQTRIELVKLTIEV